LRVNNIVSIEYDVIRKNATSNLAFLLKGLIMSIKDADLEKDVRKLVK